MKATHELAQELLALPNVPLVVEGWCRQPGLVLTAVMAEYDPDGEAILVQATPATAPAAPLWRSDYEEQDGKMVGIQTPNLFVWACVHAPTGQVEMTDLRPFDDELGEELVAGWAWRRFRLVEAPEQ